MATLPEGALMQRAAAGLAYAVIDLLGSAYGRRVLLLVGSGDNGGDALYAGALLARRGVRGRGVAAVRRRPTRAGWPRCGGPAAASVDRAERGAPRWWSTGSSGSAAAPGLRRRPAAALAEVAGVPVVAVDTPSGVDVDTGEVDGAHVEADADGHLRHPQGRHLVDPAARRAARCTWSTSASTCPTPRSRRSSPRTSRRCCRARRRTSQKYSRGVVGVRAGSAQYPGAALLSVAGAACGLAGMVRYVGDDGRRRTPSARRTPRSSARAACRPGWSAPAAASGAGDELARRSRTACRSSSTPTRSKHVEPGHRAGGAHPPRRRAGRDARRRPRRRRGPAAGARAARRPSVRRGGAAQGPAHLVAHPDGRVRVNTTGTPGWPPPVRATCSAG